MAVGLNRPASTVIIVPPETIRNDHRVSDIVIDLPRMAVLTAEIAFVSSLRVRGRGDRPGAASRGMRHHDSQVQPAGWEIACHLPTRGGAGRRLAACGRGCDLLADRPAAALTRP